MENTNVGDGSVSDSTAQQTREERSSNLKTCDKHMRFTCLKIWGFFGLWILSWDFKVVVVQWVDG